MIIGFLKLAIFGLIGLTVVYLLLSAYSRSVRREELEKRFDAGDGDGPRDAYIEEGMRDYERGLRKKLIWLVYIIPAAVFVAVFYGLNFG
ncbi:MAG: hypothetical protein V7668_02320 [Cereibacter changlensis]